MIYNLEDRTAKFGESIIEFCRKLKCDEISRPLISQIVRSSTSVGANYMEANQAASLKDFKNKIAICRKECNETKHWLRMLAKANRENVNEIRMLWKESHELILIFSKINRSCDKKIIN